MSKESLTLAEALAIGLRDNPLTRQSAAQRLGARANRTAQSAPINPSLGYSPLGNGYAPAHLENLGNYTLTATIETSGRQRLRSRQAAAQVHQADADAATSLLGLRQSITGAYIALLAANAALVAEEESVGAATKLANLTEKQVALGAAPKTNAIRAGIALQQEQQNRIAARQTVRAAQATLNSVLGRAPETPVEAAETLTEPTPGTLPTLPILSALTDRALVQRPEALSAVAAEAVLHASASLSRSQRRPDLAVGRNLDRGPLQFGVALPLDLGSIRGSVEKSDADLAAQQALTESVRQQVRLDVASARIAVERAQMQLVLFQEKLLADAADLLTRVEAGYAAGGATILDVIDAQTTLRSVRIAYIAALADERQALASLERAIGSPL